MGITASTIDVNVIIDNGNVQELDANIFFGDEEVHIFPEDTDLPTLLNHFKFFPSKSQARKNGWTGDKAIIPDGFSIFEIGKKKHQLNILKPTT